jgi:hypothetical protein
MTDVNFFTSLAKKYVPSLPSLALSYVFTALLIVLQYF